MTDTTDRIDDDQHEDDRPDYEAPRAEELESETQPAAVAAGVNGTRV